ncbi:MAG: phosphoribosylamine--glycine ligase [Clostridiales Family XIII bacterium]|jgi:phosphoribosylamine--glycine ligase|nr:phosphoribosylamine--glycine ligase [Clostridiales Family XIII bacterium]
MGDAGKNKILIVGGGGREHAIAWKLAQSPKVGEIVCAPGNAGIAGFCRCEPVSAEDIPGLAALAERERPGLTVIGPETPLALGLTDELEALGLRVFGPDKNCAQLEASKSFTKAFLARHGIPTAAYREYTDADALRKDIGVFGFPMVLKADGLAAGKGVIIAEGRAAAEAAVRELMETRAFGAAGDKVVVEELLRGTEASMLCFADGSAIVPMESAQDYKRVFDGDEGPNTGGMGAYSPSLLFDGETERRVAEEILLPTLEGFKADGLDFRGVLFVGLMLTADGPKVIEFNNRFGDPETQSVLPRLKTDLYDIMEAVCGDRLSQLPIEWDETLKTATVVMAAGGYPGAYQKGDAIHGLAGVPDGVFVFHAGTAFSEGGEIVTNGGRVLGVLGTGKTHEAARENAYAGVSKISFGGAGYRKDIGVVYNTRQ